MGQAEDALRRRRREEATAQATASQHQADSARSRREQLIRDVEALVPPALEGLARGNWMTGELLEVPGFLRKKEIAGVAVGGYRFRGKADGSAGRFNRLYLLSDGRWLYGRGSKPESFAAIVRRFAGATETPGSLMDSELPEGVVEGLRELARE